MNKSGKYTLALASILVVITLYLESLIDTSMIGQFLSLLLLAVWALIAIISALRITLTLIRHRSNTKTSLPDRSHASKVRSILVVFSLIVFLCFFNQVPSGLRVRLSLAELEPIAQSKLSTPGATHHRQRIGYLDVMAIISDEDGVWFRTFQHPDGVFGVMYSPSGLAPQPHEEDESVKTRRVGDGWYRYSVYWD